MLSTPFSVRRPARAGYAAVSAGLFRFTVGNEQLPAISADDLFHTHPGIGIGVRVVIAAPAFFRAEYPPSAASLARQDGFAAVRAKADDLGAVVMYWFRCQGQHFDNFPHLIPLSAIIKPANSQSKHCRRFSNKILSSAFCSDLWYNDKHRTLLSPSFTN